MLDHIEKSNQIKMVSAKIRKDNKDVDVIRVKTKNNRLRYLYVLTSCLRSRIDVNEIIATGNEGFN